LPPVFRYRAQSPISLNAAHAHFELNYHLIFATRYRKGVFISSMGEVLCNYWLKVAAKHNFAIDQISVVPDHLHLLVRTTPQMSIETCTLALLNDGQHFIGKHFPQALTENKIDRLWQPSAYVGTCGERTTALMKAFLSQDD
jgi:putative transposase